MKKTTFLCDEKRGHSYCIVCGGWQCIDASLKGEIRYFKWQKHKEVKI